MSLTHDRLTPNTLEMLAAFHDAWIDRLTPAALDDGVACGALRAVEVEWPVRHELTMVRLHPVVRVVETRRLVTLLPDGVRRGSDGKVDPSDWNDWVVRWGMAERRIRVRR